jgi:hypothetical protein
MRAVPTIPQLAASAADILPFAPPRLPAPRLKPALAHAMRVGPSDLGFLSICRAYRNSGGIGDVSQFSSRLAGRRSHESFSVERLIVWGSIFSFPWRDTNWVPMFQFLGRDLLVNPGSRAVLAELMPAFDGWTLATWFLQPDAALGGRSPLAALRIDLRAVLEVARADRRLVTA